MKTKKAVVAIRLLATYIRANAILLYRYDKKQLLESKWFRGGAYGRFTAIGWKWVVDSYRSCKIMGVSTSTPWPVSPRNAVVHPENITIHPDDLNNFQSFGCYFQAIGPIEIGRGTYIAPNVGIITSNHSLENLDEHEPPRPVRIGERCWIGMNSVILPGVTLGENTVVGAGSVVTKSFPDGHVVIAGSPAKVIREI